MREYYVNFINETIQSCDIDLLYFIYQLLATKQ